jgi:hypothetical protein
MGKQPTNINDINWDDADSTQRAAMIWSVLPPSSAKSIRRMDQTKLNKLLEVADQQDQIKLKILYNSVINCMRDYKDDPTSLKMKDWKTAESSLEAFIDVLWRGHFDNEPTLPNALAVVEYLSGKGWKIKKSTAYQHIKEGKLRTRQDGCFNVGDVEKYAATFLKRLDGGKVNKELERMQQERSQAETDKVKAQAEHWTLKTQIAKGMYVEKDAFERALAMRAAVFKSDLENFVHARAGEITRIVGGDPEKIPDLIEFMLEAAADFLDRYAGDRTFTVPTPPPAMAGDIGGDEEDDEDNVP